MVETEPEIELRHTENNGKESRIMADAKVIVIEPSDAEARTLQTLLRFLDLEPVHVHDLVELRRSPHGASQDCLAIIISKDTVTAVGPELVAQLRAMPQPL